MDNIVIIVPDNYTVIGKHFEGLFCIGFNERIGMVPIDKDHVHLSVIRREIKFTGIAKQLSDFVFLGMVLIDPFVNMFHAQLNDQHVVVGILSCFFGIFLIKIRRQIKRIDLTTLGTVNRKMKCRKTVIGANFKNRSGLE